jgi:sugar/nucleoside kinase (ribokinase family)
MAISSSAPKILCAGIAVQDIVFRVGQIPAPGAKAMTNEMIIVAGGCAVNAAIALARLGADARYSGPLGDKSDQVSNTLISQMHEEGVDTSGVVRLEGATAPVSGIMIDATGERMIVTYRNPEIEKAKLTNVDALVEGVDLVLIDNRFPGYVRPIAEAANRRNIPLVLDADRPTTEDDPLFGLATHVIFSSECLRETTKIDDPAKGLERMMPRVKGFLAVSNGPGDVIYVEDGALRTMPVFKIEAVDTLAAGDVFHAGFALGVAEGRDMVTSMRLGAAAAGLKCTRFGGSMGAPKRAEVDAFLAKQR